MHVRHGARARRASLTDDVPVERISHVDKQEPFEDATMEINSEIQRRRMSNGVENHRHQE